MTCNPHSRTRGASVHQWKLLRRADGGRPEWSEHCFLYLSGLRSSIRILGIFKNFQIKEGMKLQLRAQAYNFLNHPLYSFPSGSNLTLQFEQDPVSQVITQANTNFGITTQKQGARIIEFGAKFLLLARRSTKQQRN